MTVYIISSGSSLDETKAPGYNQFYYLPLTNKKDRWDRENPDHLHIILPDNYIDILPANIHACGCSWTPHI